MQVSRHGPSIAAHDATPVLYLLDCHMSAE